jgi:hypothetical protein
VEALAGLAQGLAIAFEPANLVYCMIGVFVGTAVGVLPGLVSTAEQNQASVAEQNQATDGMAASALPAPRSGGRQG